MALISPLYHPKTLVTCSADIQWAAGARTAALEKYLHVSLQHENIRLGVSGKDPRKEKKEREGGSGLGRSKFLSEQTQLGDRGEISPKDALFAPLTQTYISDSRQSSR